MNIKITQSEDTVLSHHKAGKNISEIADILSISHHTVKALLNSALRKLKLNK